MLGRHERAVGGLAGGGFIPSDADVDFSGEMEPSGWIKAHGCFPFDFIIYPSSVIGHVAGRRQPCGPKAFQPRMHENGYEYPSQKTR